MTEITRRAFVGESARGVAGLAAAASARSAAGAESANEKVVLALIGAGGRGSGLITSMTRLKNVETKYVCEVNAARGGGTIGSLEKIQGYAPQRVVDMREVLDDKDVDAVVVATPEHWHALATVWACQAEKDVYVEKNISLTIWEGRKMIEAAQKYRRVVQCGTQNRSAPYAFSAREYVRSGQLGKVILVKMYNMLPGGGFRPQPDGQPPAGLDWDKWLGPAPERPFNPGRMGWYNWWDYSGGGSMAGDASHVFDLARMVIGDPPHPKAVHCVGGRLAHDDPCEIPDVQAVTYDYGEFTVTADVTSFPPYMKKSPGDVRFGDKFPYWPQNATRTEIYGTKRMMYLGRHGGGWQVLEADGKEVDRDFGYFPDKWHQPNFIDCIRTRQTPNGSIEQGHRSACLVHLANVAYRTGNRRLSFDAETERFVGDDKANTFLKPRYRKHYRIPDTV
jgi:predicted dehydrogenase